MTAYDPQQPQNQDPHAGQQHDPGQPPTYAPPTGAPADAGTPTYRATAPGDTPYGTGSHDAGSHGTGTYGTGGYGTGSYGAPHSGNSHSGTSSYGTGSYDAGSYGAGSYGAGSYGAGSYGAGRPGGNFTGHGPYGGSPYGESPYTASPASPGGFGSGQGGWNGAPSAYAPVPARTRRGGVAKVALVAAAVALVVGGGSAAGVVALTDDGGTTSGGLALSTQAAPAAKVDGTVSAAAQAISPSVVTISVADRSGSEGGTGSGIVIKTDGGTGYILTNNHVVTLDSQTQAGSNQISVTLSSGSTVPAEVVGTDPSDDLAVVKVEANDLTPAVFASSSKLQVGQTVVAMGAPLGLSNTVTSGIVSALARPVATGSSQDAAIFNAVQTDAAINPGNSGGPLVDLNGHVVGVNSAIAGTGGGSSDSQSGNIGIGFAIPSDEASRIADELITTGKASHAVLGITVNGQQQETGPTSAAGATVASVQSDSPAAKAGIKAGDVITRIGDQRIDDSIGAIAATRSFAPGTTVPVTISSGGQSRTVQVTLGSATDS